MNLALQILSILGAVLILGAFFSLQRGWWTSRGSAYLWCNFVGAAVLTVVAVVDRRIGFVVLELAWAAVSAVALFARKSRRR